MHRFSESDDPFPPFSKEEFRRLSVHIRLLLRVTRQGGHVHPLDLHDLIVSYERLRSMTLDYIKNEGIDINEVLLVTQYIDVLLSPPP